MLTKKTQQVGIASIVYFVVAVIATGFVIQTVFVHGEVLKTKAEAVLKNDMLKQRYSDLQGVLAETSAERELLKTHILTENEVVTFVGDVEEIARSRGVDITTNSLTVSEKSEDIFKEVEMKLSISGSEQEIEGLIKALENLPYYSEVTELVLSRKDKANTGSGFRGNVTLTLGLVSYDK